MCLCCCCLSQASYLYLGLLKAQAHLHMPIHSFCPAEILQKSLKREEMRVSSSVVGLWGRAATDLSKCVHRQIHTTQLHAEHTKN